MKKPRVSHSPMKRSIVPISNRRSLEAPMAGITKSNHKKQWTQARGVAFTSRTNYQRVPLKYLEENMKRRTSQVSKRRYLKPVPFVKTLQTPKTQWVGKANPPST